jgi:hypothetical protein
MGNMTVRSTHNEVRVRSQSPLATGDVNLHLHARPENACIHRHRRDNRTCGKECLTGRGRRIEPEAISASDEFNANSGGQNQDRATASNARATLEVPACLTFRGGGRVGASNEHKAVSLKVRRV